MKMHIKATNLTVTPEISDYLQKKIDTLDKFIGDNTEEVLCDIELGKTTNHHRGGDVFGAEINIRKEGKYFRAVAEAETLYAAIDEMKDEIIRELTSHKSKQTTLVRRGGAMIKNMLRGFRK